VAGLPPEKHPLGQLITRPHFLPRPSASPSPPYFVSFEFALKVERPADQDATFRTAQGECGESLAKPIFPQQMQAFHLLHMYIYTYTYIEARTLPTALLNLLVYMTRFPISIPGIPCTPPQQSAWHALMLLKIPITDGGTRRVCMRMNGPQFHVRLA